MTASPPRGATPRGLRLWVKLAVLAGVGVVATHSIHLAVGTGIAGRSLVREQASLGRGIARLVAAEAADPILTHDIVTLSQLVARAAATEGIGYCFVVRGGDALATSFPGGTPEGLVRLRTDGRTGPVVVVDGAARFLDLEEPVLGGSGAVVRLGIDMAILQTTRRSIAAPLGALAVLVMLLGAAAALVIGRSIARPLDDLVATADRFDPAVAVAAVPPRGGREIERLADRFNLMMRRLHTAHDDRERVRAQALANARLATLGSVVAGVAHEVNNPLASLKVCVTLLRESADPQQRSADLALMDDALDRLRDVVRRLLDLGHPPQLELAPTAVVDLARDAPRLAALSLRGKGISLDEVVDPGADDVPVRADHKQVSQALLNLLLNAAYVTPAGGRVRVRIRRRGDLRGIAVEDDGPGIPPALRDRVLDPFFTTKPAGEGTGLGLALARAIVDQHHGALELECPEQGGTIVTLWLPIVGASGPEVGPPRTHAGAGPAPAA